MATRKQADRRADIVAAALSCMARNGYERTSTAQICAAAGVSSGTFFHYFPTKPAVLAAVLQDGLERTRGVMEGIRSTAANNAEAALQQWQEHVLNEAADEHLAGLAAALGSVPDNAEVAALLQAETTLTREVLTELVAAGQHQGTMRSDWAPDRVAAWLEILANGVLEYAIETGASIPELRSEMIDVVTRLTVLDDSIR
ncbi:TetR/AcrR family transcriptional regulator [Nocardioides sp. zg-ZUI104]|uniref:TetR/AcrR family transcriptional regulator n=1 Tax=Nocardioides faecalis TaxID=2803858 RepID=UPI001BCD3477|nr:TetR/AcrR family transcriptional regulator [Nocardioides faecalis]MBS4753251.1 TetR/AcrR family transcriptional regulator [Nocardioides faecalis]